MSELREGIKGIFKEGSQKIVSAVKASKFNHLSNRRVGSPYKKEEISIESFKNKYNATVKKIRFPPYDEVDDPLTENKYQKWFVEIQENVSIIDAAIQTRFEQSTLAYINELADVEYMPARTLAISLIDANFDTILKDIYPKDQPIKADDYKAIFRKGYALGSISKLVLYGTDEQREKAIPILKGNKETIIDGANSPNLNKEYDYIPTLVSFLCTNDSELMKAANQVFSNINVKDDIAPATINMMYSHLLRSNNNVVKSISEELISANVARYNVDPERMIEAWKHAHPDYTIIVTSNLGAMRAIDAEEPGAVALLNKEFGINNFGRFPENLLIEQTRAVEDKRKPYGIVLYPQNDHNGAFYQDYRIFKDLYKGLQGKYNIRFLECASKIDVARRFINLDKRYGEHQKISFALIGGHGMENRIRFGGNDEAHSLSIKDLLGSGVQRVSSFFTENPTIILNSCSTGAHNGIAQEISKVIGANVIAPDVPSNISSLAVDIQTDKLDFKVGYKKSEDLKEYNTGILQNDSM